MLYLLKKITKFSDGSVTEELLVKHSIREPKDFRETFKLSNDWELLGSGTNAVHVGSVTMKIIPKLK